LRKLFSSGNLTVYNAEVGDSIGLFVISHTHLFVMLKSPGFW